MALWTSAIASPKALTFCTLVHVQTLLRVPMIRSTNKVKNLRSFFRLSLRVSRARLLLSNFGFSRLLLFFSRLLRSVLRLLFFRFSRFLFFRFSRLLFFRLLFRLLFRFS